MTTLKQLVDQHTWTEIEPRFRELYPEASVEGHAVAYEEIRFVVPKQDNEPMAITVRMVQPDPKFFEEGGWYHVGAHNAKEDQGYAIEFTAWSWWLAQDLHEDTLKLPPIDILCHCLHEMTFCGFSQEEVEATSKKTLGEAKQAMEDWKNGNRDGFTDSPLGDRGDA